MSCIERSLESTRVADRLWCQRQDDEGSAGSVHQPPWASSGFRPQLAQSAAGAANRARVGIPEARAKCRELLAGVLQGVCIASAALRERFEFRAAGGVDDDLLRHNSTLAAGPYRAGGQTSPFRSGYARLMRVGPRTAYGKHVRGTERDGPGRHAEDVLPSVIRPTPGARARRASPTITPCTAGSP